jgi:two-component system cell cycle response regulator
MDDLLGGGRRGAGGTAGRVRLRALVVEGDSGTLGLCRRVLEAEGYAVDGSDSGVEALKLALKTVPSVIFLDLNLRDVLGLQFLEWLRSNPALHAVPVIGIAVLGGDASRLLDGGVKAVLNKPLTATAIKHALHEALRGRGDRGAANRAD